MDVKGLSHIFRKRRPGILRYVHAPLMGRETIGHCEILMIDLVRNRASVLGRPASFLSDNGLIPCFYRTISEVFINVARMAPPTRLIYLSEDR
jgi:hypothetical protein